MYSVPHVLSSSTHVLSYFADLPATHAILWTLKTCCSFLSSVLFAFLHCRTSVALHGWMSLLFLHLQNVPRQPVPTTGMVHFLV